jgi:hypothetical protein
MLAGMEIPLEAERIPLRTSAPPAVRASGDAEPPKPRLSDSLRSELAKKLAEPMPAESPAPTNRLPVEEPQPVEPVHRLPNEEAFEPPQPTDVLDRALFPVRALVPELGFYVAVTAGWFLGVVPLLPMWWRSPEVVASLPGALGVFYLVKWMFQIFGGGYKLTRREILRIIPGPIPDPDPIDLTAIAEVTVERTPAELLMFVGRIRITFERDTLPPEVLGPVSWPRRRAQRIREAIEAARSGHVIVGQGTANSADS